MRIGNNKPSCVGGFLHLYIVDYKRVQNLFKKKGLDCK